MGMGNVNNVSSASRFGKSILIGALLACAMATAQQSNERFEPEIPRTWDPSGLEDLELPLVGLGRAPVSPSPEYYYDIPVRPVYRTYPIYHPDKEPNGYLESLRQHEPEVIFDPSSLESRADWVAAGALVFEAPIAYFENGVEDVRDPDWYREADVYVSESGEMPFFRYVVREKGKIELGILSCATCHTRVMPDGSLLKGAQGSFGFDRDFAYGIRREREFRSEDFGRALFAAPWLSPGPLEGTEDMTQEQIAERQAAIPTGVAARHGTSPSFPAQIPDLIGVKDRKYLDHTGLQRHRGVADIMRYAAFNQDIDLLKTYGDFRPVGELPNPENLSRYSDEQLYALALFVYSLEPPTNPNPLDEAAVRGQEIFEEQGCPVCHTPPLFTNNMLTPVEGFEVPAAHTERFDILDLVVGTDPRLSLETRRGTGYYKVPSLRGVWYRGPFGHSGSVATLEDWFDPSRLRDDYVPSGFKGYRVESRAVKGHEFGLTLSAQEKRALIAFLKTL